MKSYLSHFGFAFRIMGKTPLATALSVVVLAVSIALVSVMFNMIESVVLSDLPYERGDKLMRITRENPENEFADSGFPFNSFHLLEEQQKVFDGIIGIFNDTVNLQTGMRHGQELGAYVSHDFCDTLGVHPIMGRTFTADDARAESPPVVLISHAAWQDYFGADPDVIGKSFMTDGLWRTIIGVMPERFDFPYVNELWLPLNTDTLAASTGWATAVMVLGRVAEGVSIPTAKAQLQEAFDSIRKSLPVENEGYTIAEFEPFKDSIVDSPTRMIFYAMAICAVLVLFMGCAIVSNLITVRSVKRSSELAIRSALGASRKQIVMQMMFESAITSAISLVLGWLLMEWYMNAVLHDLFVQLNAPAWMWSDSYGVAHLVFVIGVLILVTTVSTLIPALRASRTSLNDLLKDSSRTGSSLKMSVLGRVLIIFQIAAACAVVTGAAIVAYFLHDVNSQQTDYDPDQFLYASIGLDSHTHGEASSRVALMRNLKRALESNQEVAGVTYSSQFFGFGGVNALRDPQVDYPSPDAYPKFYKWVVAPGYFEVMGIPMLAGREFNDFDDTEHPRVVVITDVLARQLFGEEDPLGKQLIYGDDVTNPLTVVGVCGDVFQSDRDRDKRTGFMISAYQEVWMDLGLNIKMTEDPRSFESKLIQTVGSIDSRATVTGVSTLRERLESFQLGLRFFFVLFVTFGIGALVMAAVGLYGVVSFSVSQRIREIGIRLALGASPGQMVMHVFRQGLGNMAIGVLLGALAAYALRYLLAVVLNPLYESAWVYLGVLLGIVAVSCLAILVPAVRGGTTDPADALRID